MAIAMAAALDTQMTKDRPPDVSQGRVTAVPDWRVGDELLASSIERSRIVAIDPTMDADEARDTLNAVWVVELVA